MFDTLSLLELIIVCVAWPTKRYSTVQPNAVAIAKHCACTVAYHKIEYHFFHTNTDTLNFEPTTQTRNQKK